MERRYVKIYSCEECVHYNRFKDQCGRGAVVDAGGEFFEDCPLMEDRNDN